MRYKLIAAGVSLAGCSAWLSWAITADHYEKRMLGNQQLLGDIINRQGEALTAAKNLIAGLPADAGQEPESDVPLESVVETPAATEADLELVEDSTADPREPGQKVAYNQVPLDEKLRGETVEETRANLKNLIAPYTENEIDREAFVQAAEAVVTPMHIPPYVIPGATWQWDEDYDHYAKIEVTYYPQFQTLLDDREDPVKNGDIAGMIGWQNLNRFGDESGDSDVVFVRNHHLETDFQVTRSEEPLPVHVQFQEGREEYEMRQAVGTTRFRRSDVGD